MTQPKNEPVEQKQDQVGAPVDAVEYTLPDGTSAVIPTSVAAMLQELADLRAAMASAGEEVEEAVPASDPPAEEAPPAPAEEPEGDAFGPRDEEEDGVFLDSATAKRLVSERMPWVKLDSADAKSLGVLVKAALDAPAEEPKPVEQPRVDDGTNPLQVPAPLAAPEDPVEQRIAKFMISQGYKA